MKPAKDTSTPSHTLASAPEVPSIKRLLNLSLSPKAKEKHGAKLQHPKAEPVLSSPPTGEIMMCYALPIPSIKTKRLIAGDEKIKEIIKHLVVVVTNLEETYGCGFENAKSKNVESKTEDLSTSAGKDLKLFLAYCSEYAEQLEESVTEECTILNSLFKWFQQQVDQMEEISRDQNILEDLPVAAEKPSLTFAQVVKLIGKLEKLRNFVKHAPKHIEKSIERENLLAKKKSYEIIQQQIEEFIKSHSAEAPIYTSGTKQEPAHSASKRMKMMVDMYEMLLKKLESALLDQELLEAKYKDMEHNFEELTLEKLTLQSELQTLKTEKKKANKNVQAKKSEKKTGTKKPQAPKWKISPEEFLQLQKEADVLKEENNNLKEQLQSALLESEKNKRELKWALKFQMESLRSESKSKVTFAQIEAPEEEKSSEEIRPSAAVSEVSELVKSQDESAVIESSELDVEGRDLLDTSQTNITVLYCKESQDSLPAATSSQGTALPVVTEEMSEGDESESSRRKIEIQSSLMEENIKAHETPIIQIEESVLGIELEITKSSTSQMDRSKIYFQETAARFLSGLQDSATKRLPQSGENAILEYPDTELEREWSDMENEESLEDTTPEYQTLTSNTKLRIRRRRIFRRQRLEAPQVDPYESLITKLQESFSKLELQLKKQPSTTRRQLSGHDEISDKNLPLEEEELQSDTQEQLKNQTKEEANVSTIAFKIQKESVSPENLLPEEEVLSKKLDKKQVVPKIDGKVLPIPSTLKEEYPPIKKQKKQPVDKLDQVMDGGITIEDLKSERVDQIQEAKQKKAAEPEDTSESHVLLNPSISDIISFFELDKVVENDLEYLRSGLGPHLLTCELKKLPTFISGIDLDQLREAFPGVESKTEFKTILRNSSLTATELFAEAKGEASSLTRNLLDRRMNFLKRKERSLRQVIRTKVPTRVINLKFFCNQVEDGEIFSPYVTASLKPFYTTLRPMSAIRKKHRLFVVKSQTTEMPKILSVREKPFKLPNLRIMTTTTKMNLNKGKTKIEKLNELLFELQKNQIMTSAPEKSLYKVFSVTDNFTPGITGLSNRGS